MGCSGLEERLVECMHAGWGKHNCHHSEDVGINCKADHGDIYLYI